MVTANVKISRDIKPPELPGIHYRLLCMTGKNKGLSYYLKGKRLVMGRSDNVDIQVADAKSSREHAELTQVADKYVVTDLGSHNGLIVNDLKISQHTLTDGDKIIIGQTVYKFNKYDIAEKALQEVDDEDDDDEEWDDEDEDEEEEEEEKAKPKKKAKPQTPEEKRKKMLIIVVVLVGAWVLLDEGEKPKAKPKQQVATEEKKVDSLEERLRRQQEEENKETRDKLEAIIHRGQREFREGNYFRAIKQFNLALILSPANGRASFYLNKAKQRLDEEIDLVFLKAKREAEALRYTDSLNSYCSIIRMLQDRPEDERRKDAENSVAIIEKEMGKLFGEIECFEGHERVEKKGEEKQ
ncbi:MAG: FHA domain-containing protein [Deltaproteobacteria bacterium]|nr:MAG: FHA domain-containing protein [Deltaproteobacteria bacterium]TNF31593.1 MAG: FHA domain-containing protein [Deltaproteobacteria bacterium]